MVWHLRFFFHWILCRCPLCNTWGSGESVAPPIPLISQVCLIGILLGFTWTLLFQLHQPSFFLEVPLRILWVLLVTLAWNVLGVLWCALLAHSGHSLARLSNSLLLGVILFDRIYQWPCKPVGNWYCPPCFYRVRFLSLFINFSWGTAWPVQGACRTQQAWLSRCRYLFWLLDYILRSEFLLNSHPSNIRLEAIVVPVVDWNW